MATIIKLILDGIPVEWDPATDPDPRVLATLVRSARAAGFQGQPLRSAWSGGKAGRPVGPQPSVDAQGRLCCPYDGGILRQKEALGGKWACDARNPAHAHVNERGYCRYFIAPEDVTVSAPALAGPAPNGPPATADEAASRFWRKYGPVVGGAHWGAVQRFLGELLPKPTTIEEWVAVANEVRDRQAAA